MSSPSSSRPFSQSSDQPSVGKVLRERREELGWRLEDVAEWLRIRPKLLAALEADDLSGLPGVAYAVGFLRTYAHAMQLDADALVERFRRDTRGAVTRKTELVFPQPEGDRGLPVGVLVGAGLVVVAVAYVGWYRFTAHDTPAQRQIPAVAELMPGAATPATTSPQVASVMPGRAPTPEPHAPVVASPTPAGPPTVSSPVQTAAAPQNPPASAPEQAVPAAPSSDEDDAPVPTPPTETVAPEKIPTPGQPATDLPPAVPEGAVVVRALSHVWAQVRDKDGHVLMSRVMQPGESWQGDPAGAPFHMSFGNAGGVVLTTAGATSAPLGREGQVRRNVEVTADAIRSGSFGSGVALPVQPSALPSPTATDATAVVPPVAAKPSPAPVPHKTPPPEHDVSADDLNARQLEHQPLEQSSPPH
ncbi:MULTISPECIES: helix-turn-helix domain-containing protein [Gluconobacter]|uniref:Helix-turn-helix domain-containing protein n=1 Tax=Gluconobacter cadivus TaxID=2728101 RepID=A0ABR9YW55_9PROT|nr:MULTISPECIES: helix-turn-helix domain-containing protein [Gluconobacter]MBF0888142.1 helix-turn-helix domain-containing protein [Gluconobacter cadivus]MBS1059617.1 helix-turn-helix domain-containing protein [Gluconobacter sp. Dm-44]